MCTQPGHVVVDIVELTGASARASKASGRHFFGFEQDQRIFDILLKPMSDRTKEVGDDDDANEDLRASKDIWDN